MSKNKPTNSDADDKVRLNRYLSMCGVCSRRKADEHIEDGQVRVNGKVVYEMGLKISPSEDQVFFKKQLLKLVEEFTYLVVYKPRSVLTTLDDPLDRPTILDMIPKKFQKLKLFPVGRLDWNSEGLLILTNDGDYAQNILHPKKNVPKTYEVKIEGKFLPKDAEKLVRGVTIPGGKARAIKVDTIKKSSTGTHTWIKITVVEGRNKLIRKMMDKLGHSVMRLRRVSIGNLKVSHLKAGDWAELSHLKKDLVFDVPSALKKLI
jgi:23S rRNA pseudouridine2605 synthase